MILPPNFAVEQAKSMFIRFLFKNIIRMWAVIPEVL